MRVIFRISVVALAVVGAVAPADPALVEAWYSTGAYPLIQRSLTPVSNLVPFAWLDLLVIAAFCALAFAVTRGILRARKTRAWRPVAGALASVITAGAVIYLVFLVIWGLNYRRLPMTERLVFDRDSVPAEAVLELGRLSAARLNALHAEAHARGWRTAPWRDRELREAFAFVLGQLADAPAVVPGRLKSSLLGPYFRWTNVDGMINPFALEAIANPDLLPFERPFVAAHEWAHLAGYADESEASFVGWLTCIRSTSPSAYSGWLFLYWQIASEVGRAEGQQLASALQEGPRRDIAAITERLQRGQVPLLRDAGWRVYDGYLKANRVDAGVRSYSEVITLLARARFEEGWTPVRRLAAGSRR